MMMTPARRRAPAMQPEQRREMIVRSAIPLVAEHGAAVTTAQIARAAGIAEGTVFRAFADKEELLDACVAEVLRPDHAVAEIGAIPLDQPLAARLTEATEILGAHLDRIGTVIGGLYASGHGRRARPGPGTGPAPDRNAGLKEIRDAVADLFEPDRDSLRLPPERLASALLGLLFAQARGGWSGDQPHLGTEEVIELFLHGALSTGEGQ